MLFHVNITYKFALIKIYISGVLCLPRWFDSGTQGAANNLKIINSDRNS